MPMAEMDKLRANIESSRAAAAANADQATPDGGEALLCDTYFVPPVIVRSLERTVEFKTDQAEGRLQILDGEHRWRVLKQMGETEIEVRIWRGVTDERAWTYLLTINELRGTKNKRRRAELIQNLMETEDDAEAWAAILPENIEEIKKAAGEVAAKAVEKIRQNTEIRRQEPMTLFVLPEHAEVIREAIKLQSDKLAHVEECIEGAALSTICQHWLSSGGV